MKNDKYIYFLDWMHENYNISPSVLLSECDSENCGWKYSQKNKSIELIHEFNVMNSNVLEICNKLFDWKKWKQKFKGKSFERMDIIQGKWKAAVKANNGMAKFSKQEIYSFNHFDFSFDLKFG